MNKEEIEEIKKLLFQDKLTQYGKRKLVQYLEQKETILDKVTDKLKEKIELVEDVIDLCKADGKIAKYKIEQLEQEKEDLQEILNIIEGEKK